MKKPIHIFNIFTKSYGKPVPFYRALVSLGSVLWILMSLTPRLFADLTDVTLADEDNNSIPTDGANRAIRGNALQYIVM